MTRRFPSVISLVAMTALLLRSWPPASIFDGDGCGRLHSWMDGCCTMPVTAVPPPHCPVWANSEGRCERTEDHLKNLSATVHAP